MTANQFKSIPVPPSWLESVLVGTELASLVRLGDHCWQIGLHDHCTITTDSLWRLLGPSGIIVTSEDEGQRFGLPAPINVCELVMGSITTRMAVKALSISPVTADLRLDFGQGVILEIVSSSCGYEAWSLRSDINGDILELIAGGSGRLSVPINQRD